MRCPKCHYLSFEPEPRCRNCGYDPELSAPAATQGSHAKHEEKEEMLETPAGLDEFRREVPERPRRRSAVAAAGARVAARAASLDHLAATALEPPLAAPPLAPPPPAAIALDGPALQDESVVDRAPTMRLVPVADTPPATSDLPLFVRAAAASALPVDEPLIDLHPAPRPPLVVRRSPPMPNTAVTAVPRVLSTFDRDLAADLRRLEVVERRQAAIYGDAAAAMGLAEPVAGAVSIGRRLQAALIDLSILGTIACAVLWLTVRWAGLPTEQVLELPLPPIAAYLLLMASGYVLLFTVAGGQTVGKMLMGLRVVTADDEATPRDVPWRQAAMRAIITIPSVLFAGAGFLLMLGGGGQAVHDRLSETRVVRA